MTANTRRAGWRRQLLSAMALLSVGCGGACTTNVVQTHTCSSPLLGTWKLQSFTMEFADTHQTVEPFGSHPSGYLSYAADCRMYGIVVRGGRRPPVAADPHRP